MSNSSPAPESCSDCGIASICRPDGRLLSCFAGRCQTCDPRGCQEVCPRRELEFNLRFGEVLRAFGGTLVQIDQSVMEPEVPRYIPQIYAASRRNELLDASWAAIPLYRLIGFRPSQGYSRLIDDREAFDKRFQIRRDANLIAIGSNFDQKLENFWTHRDGLGDVTALTFLGIRLVTVPNYSFFLDMLESTRLYNFGRIVMATEAIQTAGFTPVPHLNAITDADWDRWHHYLKGQPKIRYVAKEFGTGLQSAPRGDEQIRKLANLQERLGRALHVVAIGGGQFTPHLAHFFSNFTVVDSDAYMKTVRWQEARIVGGKLDWRRCETGTNVMLDDLLLSNVKVMRNYIDLLALRRRQIPVTSKLRLFPRKVA